MADLLELSSGLPEVELAPGEVLVEDGTRTGSIWVLVSGRLDVRKDGVLISTIERPGSGFGEIAVLRGSGHTATVVAAEPCRLRYAADGQAFLHGQPEVLFVLARGLAERLDLITSYLADLRNQYAGAAGLEMVSEVLGKLQGAPPMTVQPGSARDPDPDD